MALAPFLAEPSCSTTWFRPSTHIGPAGRHGGYGDRFRSVLTASPMPHRWATVEKGACSHRNGSVPGSPFNTCPGRFDITKEKPLGSSGFHLYRRSASASLPLSANSGRISVHFNEQEGRTPVLGVAMRARNGRLAAEWSPKWHGTLCPLRFTVSFRPAINGKTVAHTAGGMSIRTGRNPSGLHRKGTCHCHRDHPHRIPNTSPAISTPFTGKAIVREWIPWIR